MKSPVGCAGNGCGECGAKLTARGECRSSGQKVCGCKKWNTVRKNSGLSTIASHPQESLIFVQVFIRNIILRHFVGMHFALIFVICGFNTRQYVCLESISFFEQLVNTFGIRAFHVGQPLEISRLLPRTLTSSFREG